MKRFKTFRGNIRFLQGSCLFVVACAALPFAAAISDSSFQACGYGRHQDQCTDASTLIGVNGTIIIAAIVLFVWLGGRKEP